MGISGVLRNAFRPHEAPLMRWLRRLNDRESQPLHRRESAREARMRLGTAPA